jgi:alpha,alpha-trehalase
MLAKWAIAAYAINAARSVPQGSITAPPGTSTGAPSITLITSIASPTAPLTATLPSQVPLPPVQAWCPSEIFCAGAVCHFFFFALRDSSANVQSDSV